MVMQGGVKLLVESVASGKWAGHVGTLAEIAASLATDAEVRPGFVQDGGLSTLVYSLTAAGGTELSAAAEAAWAIAHISSIPGHANALIEAGVLPPLLAIAGCANVQARLQALWALANLSIELPGSFGDVDAMRQLLDLLDGDGQGAPSETVSVHAALGITAGGRVHLELTFALVPTRDHRWVVQVCRALAALGKDAWRRDELIAASGFSRLLGLLGSQNASAQVAAAQAVANLTADAVCAVATLRSESFRLLTEALYDERHDLLLYTLTTLSNVAADAESARQVLAQAGESMLERLVVLLQSESQAVKKTSLDALIKFTATPTQRSRLLNKGVFEPLLALSDEFGGASPDTRASSRQLLDTLSLALTPASRRAILGGRLEVAGLASRVEASLQSQESHGFKRRIPHKRSPLMN